MRWHPAGLLSRCAEWTCVEALPAPGQESLFTSSTLPRLGPGQVRLWSAHGSSQAGKPALLAGAEGVGTVPLWQQPTWASSLLCFFAPG